MPGLSTGKTNAVTGPPGAGPIFIRPSTSARPPEVDAERHIDRPQTPSSPDPNLLRESRIKKEMRSDFYSGLFSKEETLPPFLPKSRFPTVPPRDITPPGKWKRPLTCPQKWLAQQEEKSWFEKSDFRTNLNEAEKRNIIMSFISRNKNDMWKYDPQFRNKSLNEICDDIMSQQNFLNVMRGYCLQERSQKLGTSSAKMMSALSNRQTAIGEICHDPFIASIHTSRMDRSERMTRLMTPSCEKSEFARGYRHAPEYGNFSAFNGILKSNSGAVLNR